ncbi:hypothetical protein [Cellulomonas sp. NPDC058312]|uniref:VG15 protein n=1 Tax=Cellulomonas sp. NPDC058312 TaxID=3346441 RepID=UPI0036E67691
MASLAEQRAILQELHDLGLADLDALWRQAQGFDDFYAFIVEAFPELAFEYGTMAAELSTIWYDDAAPELAYTATPAELPPFEQFAQSAQWALNTSSGVAALGKLSGTLQRGVWGMARQTTILNAETEPGARWARHASANACEFCRMVATRKAVYTSEQSAMFVGGRGKDVSTNFDENGKRKRGGQAKGVRTRGTQKLGDKFHDHCHCVAVQVRPGAKYEPPDYVAKWEQEYKDAVAATPGKGKYGAIDVQAVQAAMRQNNK